MKGKICRRKCRLSLGIEGMERDNEYSNNHKMKCNYGVNYPHCPGTQPVAPAK